MDVTVGNNFPIPSNRNIITKRMDAHLDAFFMKKFFPILALVLSSSLAIVCQNITPLATPTPSTDTDVVKISTNLIQLDVTVTDSKGKVITDLRQDEIQIYENGKRQDITNFSFISNVQTETVKEKAAAEKPGLPPPPVKAENVRRTIALLVDDFNMSFSSSVWVRDALKKFVNEQMQDGDLVAVIVAGRGIGPHQQFTNDKRVLLAAIAKIRFNMTANSISAFESIRPSLLEQVSGVGDNDFTEDIARERDMERDMADFRNRAFTSGTLGAVNYVVRGMGALPGRKSIMLFSEGFPLVERGRGGMITGFSDLVEPMQNLTDQANRASVVIYTIDPRGLVTTGLDAADDTSGLTSEQVDERLNERSNELRDTQDALVYIARETGGFAVINNNDLNAGIRRVLQDQSYYLVGYQPDDDSFDPKNRRFNKLVVKVLRKGARVRYRSGFFGVTDKDVGESTDKFSKTLLGVLASPFAANDITVRLNALYNGREKDGEALRSFIHIDGKDLTFAEQPDGTFKTTFDVLAVTYGDAGLAKDRIVKGFAVNLNRVGVESIKKTGIIYEFTLLVKNPGAYQMRVAVRDTTTNKAGSASQFIEVPNLKKNRLSLSGVMLRNTPYADWQKRQEGTGTAPNANNAKADTAIRQFAPGTVLDYAVTIYNAKLDAAKKTNLTIQARLFQDEKQIFESRVSPVEHPATGFPAAGSTLLLGAALPAGNYTLQLIVTDNNIKGKSKTAMQFVPFEIVR